MIAETVVLAAPANPPVPPCPKCGGVLEIDPACKMTYEVMNPLRNGPKIWKVKIAPAALCTACEFCIEIEADAGFRIVR